MADTPAERARKRAWEQREREKDPEGFKQRAREAQKRYYEKHGDKIRARRRKYHAENREKERARGREDYARNGEKRRAASRKWKAENREKVRAYQKEANLVRYGITYEEKTALFEAQGKKCACCGSKKTGGRNWHIDHCHKGGQVRAILCHACNVTLGLVREDPDHLQKLIRYIETHNGLN